MSVIKQKLAKKEGATFDRRQDIASIQDFYKYYREEHQLKELQEEERNQRTGVVGDQNELEQIALKKRKVFTTLRVLKDVVDALSSTEADAVITSEFKEQMESDVADSEELKAYNILSLEAPGVPDIVGTFREVNAAVLELEFSGQLPEDFTKPKQRHVDVFDVLGYVFGFQPDNVSNQREHLVLLLASVQSQLGIDGIHQHLDEKAITELYDKVLDNYKKWCGYVRTRSVDQKADNKKMRIFFMSLYLLIWGEAANVRFLPECICYIFHRMALELWGILQDQAIVRAESCIVEDTSSFLNQIILPVYTALKAEAEKNLGGKAAHSKWRNYDDFNEFFWSPSCFDQLKWPWNLNSPFFSKSNVNNEGSRRLRRHALGKTSFVEHRTFFHLYHSFHRVWIFLVMMLQGLTILSFSKKLDLKTLKILLSLGPTYFFMNLIESALDIFLMFGAYKSTRRKSIAQIFVRFIFFGGCAGGLFYLYLKMMLESNNVFFKIYLLCLGLFVVFHIIISLAMHIPAIRILAEKGDRFKLVDMIKSMFQARSYVGRGLFERPGDFIRYVLFWAIVLGCKFSFGYFLLIKPLADATRVIVNTSEITYTWHDFFSRHNHNALAVAFFWAPVVMIYLLDISIWYTVFSAILGGLIGAKERLGEIRSLEMLANRFDTFPMAFVENLQPQATRGGTTDTGLQNPSHYAARFAPFWNEIVNCLRLEDYIKNREKELLLMPSNDGNLSLVQWPLFLLVSKVFLAMDLAIDSKDTSQIGLWEKLKKDQYMSFAVQEAYESLRSLLGSLLNDEGNLWVKQVDDDMQTAISQGAFFASFEINKLQFVVSRITALTGLLVKGGNAEQAFLDLFDAVTNEFCKESLRSNYSRFEELSRNRRGWFGSMKWDSRIEERQKECAKRLHLLLTIKESAANIPKNLEAQRRLQFFTNSLFMKMPKAPTVRSMKSFSVYTPYFSEIVLYSKEDLRKENEDGISTIFYLQKIFPDEWRNFRERISATDDEFEERVISGKLETSELQELRLWASYRGQTLARTVRGMMYYRRALMLQSFLENPSGDIERGYPIASFESSFHARAQADIKFTYVITCQIYGQQKQKQDARAADILYLMQRNEGLRIAFIDTVESEEDGKPQKEYFSKLVKADLNRKDHQEIYSIQLPGNPVLGEGKPENQNHAIIFTRGEAVQTIDMNQDNYFEEALKMCNLLEEFKQNHGIHVATILGVREHVFTGSVSSLASFMSNQETSFVTLGQRVLASPLKVRMHYGHPDVFDRIFHVTRGGISKASKVINISEDIFAGFNSTLRQGNITHHEYIQVGKGRDVGLNQIALFEAKVSSGNGEQSLSRDVYRLGQLFDFFRLLSFYSTSVGYYVCTMMTTLVIYVFLYGKAYLALSGVGQSLEDIAEISNNTALESALNAQFLFQIGIFTAVPMLMGFILEQGILQAIMSFVTMQLQLCSIFFTFSLGTRTHYFGRTILHGGAKYRATGRGFVVQHIKFADNYRLYSRSHFVKALEIVMLLLVYLAYGYAKTSVGYLLLSFSSWILAISWLFAPYIFNPSGFEWQKTVDDFDDWINWLFYRGGVGVKGEDSWEAWWEEEQEHIRSLRGKILETILSLRFFFFQYGVVYHLKAAGKSQSLAVYGISWLVLVGIILIFKVFSFSQKASVNFQMLLRLVQGMVFIMLVAGLVVIVALTPLSIGDVFASLLAVIPTGWGILSIGIAWKHMVKTLGLWTSFRAIARFYDAAMGMIIFFPVAVLSWFPFVSTFQTRLLFNQAFSRGLEISLILAGNRPNVQA